MYDGDWWGARLYLVPPEGNGISPDITIQFSGLRRDLAERALPAMVQALADAVGVPIGIRIPNHPVGIHIPNHPTHPADHTTVSPSAAEAVQ